MPSSVRFKITVLWRRNKRMSQSAVVKIQLSERLDKGVSVPATLSSMGCSIAQSLWIQTL